MFVLDEGLTMETYSEWLQTKGWFWALVLEVKPVKTNHKEK